MGKFVEQSSIPESNAVRTWFDPTTGEESTFPLQHAIDYAHFVDGHLEPIPASIGKSFCCPPRRRSSSQRSQYPDNLTLFNPLDDDDDNSIPEPASDEVDGAAHRPRVSSRKRPAELQSGTGSSIRQRTTNRAPGTLQADAQIAQLLLNHPELTERFLQLQANAAIATRDTTFQESSIPAHPEQATDSTPQYTVGPSTEVTTRSKYAFSPSVHQTRIHALATAPRHQGKNPSVFIESLITSGAVTFKPSPSVLVRIFDLSFGTRGLSIMHFAPLKTMNDKAIWIITGGVNMQNFSAAVPLPPASQPQSIEDVLDAALALETFSNEYFSASIQDLVCSLVKFTKQQLRGMVWQPVDLILVVFWMNSLLEKFRVELETGASDGSAIKLRCSFDDPDFRQIIVQIQQRQIQQLQSAVIQPALPRSKTKVASPKVKAPATSYDGSSRKGTRTVKSEYAIPPEVYALLPVQNEKRLCLRFISNAGCRSTSSTSCTASSRAHFVPEKLDQLVREFVDEKFGGVKSEYARL